MPRRSQQTEAVQHEAFLERWGSSKQCSDIGMNCMDTKCCKNLNFVCYWKDPPWWAECMENCIPGPVEMDMDKPKEQQASWDCGVVGKQQKSKLTVSLSIHGPEAAEAENVMDETDKCTPKYGNCLERECCVDPSSKQPVQCFKRDKFWSECRDDCPPHGWFCSNETTHGHHSHKNNSPNSSQARTVARKRPSLYCFSAMLSWGSEIALIRTHLAKGVGIFSCSDWSVISNDSIMLSPGPPVRISSDVMEGPLRCEFGGEYHTALNSEIFYRVWKKVIAISKFALHDWTVKVDPDAVLLPTRLREHVIERNAKEALYLNNCFEGLHGPIEVVSHGAMKVYSKDIEYCHKILEPEWMTYGEDVWLRRCLGLLAVRRVDDYAVLREKACKPFKDPMPCTANAVSFHPLKTVTQYFECLDQATSVDPVSH